MLLDLVEGSPLLPGLLWSAYISCCCVSATHVLLWVIAAAEPPSLTHARMRLGCVVVLFILLRSSLSSCDSGWVCGVLSLRAAIRLWVCLKVFIVLFVR
uniref:Uncharacterized protein n=1 Tax=Physcomitrium patens TaxID=3218 RepID=A0A2K1INX5_PHYPA|nr:hypothetical protein PHYPA_027290 [Physcomitrium patens]